MNLTNRFLIFLVLAVFSGFFMNCANQMAPTGGPKDETPPVVLLSDPANMSTGFSEKRIVLDFNEYVQLKDVNKQLIMSPPLLKSPELRLRGKSVIIDLDEELKPESTYTINFGKSIVDLTESNPLTDFQYVFSTGGFIDSLALSGKTLNAFDLKPPKDIFTMLYSESQTDTIPLDSMPFRIPPYFVTRNAEDGSFMFTHLKPGRYALFSLKDLNSNYLYDLPNEEVAFLDSLISPEIPIEVEIDSIPGDSISMDTTKIHRHSLVVKSLHQIRLFKPMDTIQRVDKKEAIDSTHIMISFRIRPQNPKFSFLEPPFSNDDYFPEMSPEKDTNIFWLKNPVWDTLRIEVSDHDRVVDTVTIVNKPPNSKKTKNTPQITIGSPLQISSNASSRTLDLDVPFRLKFNRPVKTFDFSRISIMTESDTLMDMPFGFIDSLKRTAQMSFNFDESKPYKILIPQGSFSDIYDAVNDTTEIVFTTKAMRDYGALIINVSPIGEGTPLIIQLLTEKEAVLKQQVVEHGTKIRFDYLKPGKYLLKAISDTNRNGRWDTGNYSVKLQPENVYYIGKTIEIKSNWDVEEDWEIK